VNISEYMTEAHATAVEKGWWQDGDRNFGEQIALMHSELSEALEHYREYGLDPKFMMFDDGDFDPVKPDGIAVEFADLLIRLFDTCERYHIPLESALQVKMKYNKTRPFRHNNKLA